MTAEEARRQALIKLGGLEQTKEIWRERRGIPFFETFWQDTRYGARMLRKNPWFTLAAVLTLALGIGANTAIFSVVNAVLLRPLPYNDANKLVVLNETNQRVGLVSVSYPDFLDWRQQNHSFSAMAAASDMDFDLAGAGQPELVGGYAVSPNFLSLLGVRPILGRDFVPAEEKPGTAPVALISYKLWQSHFGGAVDVVGKTLRLDDKVFTIIGVLPANFRLPANSDVLAPIGIWAGEEEMQDRGDRGDMVAIGRLAPGVTLAQARGEMEGIAARLAAEYPRSNSEMGVSLQTMRQEFVGDVRAAMLVVFGAVILVLLIACVNVAGLFLVRGAARAQEIAVRMAFGASRGRIVKQMLTESLLLAVIGGGLGLLLGAWGVSGLARLVGDPLGNVPIRIDGNVLLFVGVVVILVAVAFGLVPALQATRPDIQESLKEGERGGAGGTRQHRLRNAFAVAETALALVLLVGAGLMLQSLYRLMRVNPGFRPDRVLKMGMNLRSTQYSTKDAKLNFWRQVLEHVRALPGVENAALGTTIPFTGDHSRSDITIEGLPLPAEGEFPHPDFHIVSPGFFSTMGIRLLRGRTFTDEDNSKAAPVAIINQTLARRFWPDGEAVGKRILYGHPNPNEKWVTIVGVVGDTRMYGLDSPARFEVYAPLEQMGLGGSELVVRSAKDPASLTGEIRGAIASVNRDVPIYDVETLKKAVDDSVSTRRDTLLLLGSFSLLAVVLAATGIYGVISYVVALRTHEIGVRMALGAGEREVLRFVLGQGAWLAIGGVGIGTLGALALTRLMASLLYGVRPADPATFAGAAILIASVALVATYVPARRATRIDPVVALRQE
ncbi:MAG: ABC transporter permease, partial [Acidobacteriota bacterium]|nr:ABC transporter permease [Acidobacteriota bacterium]